MLWDRKIQLTREMQDAIDPEVGQAETAAMKKEIQRMQLRYTQLQKKQRELLQDMEKSIYRRESISSAYAVDALYPSFTHRSRLSLFVRRTVASLRPARRRERRWPVCAALWTSCSPIWRASRVTHSSAKRNTDSSNSISAA